MLYLDNSIPIWTSSHYVKAKNGYLIRPGKRRDTRWNRMSMRDLLVERVHKGKIWLVRNIHVYIFT